MARPSSKIIRIGTQELQMLLILLMYMYVDVDVDVDVSLTTKYCIPMSASVAGLQHVL